MIGSSQSLEADARVYLGECVAWLRSLEPASVDAIVCDPPYGLGFMGKEWDALPPGREWAEACLRALKPGGHLIAFGGTRTVHRLACAVEDAGFEIRDTIGWVYFSGFPKSLDVSKAIDAAAGAVREVVGVAADFARDGASRRTDGSHVRPGYSGGLSDRWSTPITAPATPDAERWAGWGTALKPAYEPAVLARKPMSGTVAATVLEHGTGALNIDGCRFAPGDPAWIGPQDNDDTRRPGNQFRGHLYGDGREGFGGGHDGGRWPANLYYCPKVSRRERERGCDGLPNRTGAEAVERAEGSAGVNSPRAGAGRTANDVRNIHPTVKPVQLMRWLCRLVTPPGGLVVDPFTGSGSTGVAAVLEGFRFRGAEMQPEYHAIATARLAHVIANPHEWDPARPKPKRARQPKPEAPAQLSLISGRGR